MKIFPNTSKGEKPPKKDLYLQGPRVYPASITMKDGKLQLKDPYVHGSNNGPTEIQRTLVEFPSLSVGSTLVLDSYPSIPNLPNLPFSDKDKLGLLGTNDKEKLNQLAEKIDKNIFTTSVSRKMPLEIVLNEDKEKFSLKDEPFQVYDHETGEIRRFVKEDGYMYFMSKIRDDPENKHPKLKYLFCITIFSEGLSELRDTLKSVYKNLDHFAQHGIDEKQIAVFVVFDGIQPIAEDIRQDVFMHLDKVYGVPRERTLEARQKQFEEDTKKLAKGDIPKMPIMASYIYEWEFGPEEFYETKDYPTESVHYLKVFLAVKLKNAQKISSVVWFFRGYCEHFQPQFCSLMDCGTIPYNDAIWKSFKTFEGDEDVGGVCGYILPNAPVTMDRKDMAIMSQMDCVSRVIYKIFDLRTSQIFEYGFGHIFDKAFESVIGFIYVLPGAFSSLRWEAIRKQDEEYNKKYMQYEFVDRIFVQSVLDPKYKDRDEYNLELANMCLAEDQMLTFEVMTKQGKKFTTKYLPDSVALTDPVKTLPVLMKQRKRWINGSWYANLNIMNVYFKKLSGTTHSHIRKFFFHFFWFYIYVVNLSRYFILSYFFSLIFIFSQEVLKDFAAKDYPFGSMQAAFLMCFLVLLYATFHYSLFCKPDQAVRQFQMIVTIMGVFVHIFTVLVIFKVLNIIFFQDDISTQQHTVDKYTVIAMVSFNLLFYAIPTIMNIRTVGKDLIRTFVPFYFHFPLYFVFFQIYAFCNTNDLSWGTKAKESEGLNEKMEKFKMYNVYFTAKWLMFNTMFCFLSMILNSNDSIRAYYILGYAYLFTFFCLIKFVGAIIFKLKYDLWDTKKWTKTVLNKRGFYLEESKTFLTFYIDEMKSLVELEKV